MNSDSSIEGKENEEALKWAGLLYSIYKKKKGKTLLMESKFYLNPDSWEKTELNAIRTDFTELQFEESIDAAIGTGAGGTGFETVIEILLNNQLAAGVLSGLLVEVVKVLWKHRPKKKKLPPTLAERNFNVYELIVHLPGHGNPIVIINLNETIENTEKSIDKLENIIKDNPNASRVIQNKDKWNVY